MSTAKPSSKKKTNEKDTRQTVLLALSLIPLGLGVIGLIIWGGFDKSLFESEEVHLLVSGFYLLLGLSMNNLVRKKWFLGAGWILPSIAVLVALNVVAEWAGTAAIAITALGLVMLLLGFIQEYRIQRSEI
jgi:hypothetical protein